MLEEVLLCRKREIGTPVGRKRETGPSPPGQRSVQRKRSLALMADAVAGGNHLPGGRAFHHPKMSAVLGRARAVVVPSSSAPANKYGVLHEQRRSTAEHLPQMTDDPVDDPSSLSNQGADSLSRTVRGLPILNEPPPERPAAFVRPPERNGGQRPETARKNVPHIRAKNSPPKMKRSDKTTTNLPKQESPVQQQTHLSSTVQDDHPALFRDGGALSPIRETSTNSPTAESVLSEDRSPGFGPSARVVRGFKTGAVAPEAGVDDASSSSLDDKTGPTLLRSPAPVRPWRKNAKTDFGTSGSKRTLVQVGSAADREWEV